MRRGWALVKEGKERTDFFTKDPEIKPRDWARIGNFWSRVLRKGDWWVVAGSSATGWPRGWWKKLILNLQIKGVTVVVDSRGALLHEAVLAGTDWIKCNLEEAEGTAGKKRIGGSLPKLLGEGTTGAVVTMGKHGLEAIVNGTRLFIPAPKVKVKDPTGSGDVVTAVLIHGEIRGWTMERTLRTATRAGAWKARGIGNVAKSVLRVELEGGNRIGSFHGKTVVTCKKGGCFAQEVEDDQQVCPGNQPSRAAGG
jgi:fructose-1-phosphate kinase PfkB-like protein